LDQFILVLVAILNSKIMEKTCYKLLCFLFLILCPVLLKAQAYLTDINGKPIQIITYTDVQGSPYLTDNWVFGLVKLANGTTYKDIALKYDQVADELLFKNKDGQALSFVDQVLEFKLNYIEDNQVKERLFRSGYPGADRNTNKNFYEVLYNGNTQLVKRVNKLVNETRAYSSATTIKSIAEADARLYLFRDKQMLRLKKDKKSIIDSLGKDAAQLEKFISANKLNLKNDGDLIKVFAFADTL